MSTSTVDLLRTFLAHEQAADRATSHDAARGSETSDRAARPPILIVDDCDDDVAALLWAFKRLGIAYPVRRCSSGDDAMAYLTRREPYDDARRSPRPALILLDLNLGAIDGRDVLSVIKRDPSLRSIPTIIWTTSSNTNDVEICYDRGANSYLRKLVDMQQFLRSLQSVADYWLNTVILPAKH